MEQSLENKTEITSKFKNFYEKNKFKIYILISILVILVASFILIKHNKDKKNIFIAEKYVQAGIYLTSKQSDDAKNLYEEIILSKNKFYSILALNTIIEKNLILDKEKILNFFSILEDASLTKEQEDLLKFKKALYLIKITDTEIGNNLLKDLIDKNSTLKPLAQDILEK